MLVLKVWVGESLSSLELCPSCHGKSRSKAREAMHVQAPCHSQVAVCCLRESLLTVLVLGEVCSPYDEGAKPQPSTGQKREIVGPETIPAGARIWTKAPSAFPDSNAVLQNVCLQLLALK